MAQPEHEHLKNLLAIVLTPRSYGQKKVVAQIFVMRWAIAHGVDLTQDSVWCK
jgi:hypothetical protein